MSSLVTITATISPRLGRSSIRRISRCRRALLCDGVEYPLVGKRSAALATPPLSAGEISVPEAPDWAYGLHLSSRVRPPALMTSRTGSPSSEAVTLLGSPRHQQSTSTKLSRPAARGPEGTSCGSAGAGGSRETVSRAGWRAYKEGRAWRPSPSANLFGYQLGFRFGAWRFESLSDSLPSLALGRPRCARTCGFAARSVGVQLPGTGAASLRSAAARGPVRDTLRAAGRGPGAERRSAARPRPVLLSVAALRSSKPSAAARADGVASCWAGWVWMVFGRKSERGCAPVAGVKTDASC